MLLTSEHAQLGELVAGEATFGSDAAWLLVWHVEDHINLFASPPAPLRKQPNSVGFRIASRSAGRARLTLFNVSSLGRAQLATFNLTVYPADTNPWLVLPYRASCVDSSVPCACPPLGVAQVLDAVSVLVSCKRPCGFVNTTRFREARGLYVAATQKEIADDDGGWPLSTRPPLLKDGQHVLVQQRTQEEDEHIQGGAGLRLVFVAEEGRWYLTRGAGTEPVYRNGQVENVYEDWNTLFPSYFRTTPGSAVASPAAPTAKWEEWVFDDTLVPLHGKHGGYWKPSASFSITAAANQTAQCLPAAAYIPGLSLGGPQGFRDKPPAVQLDMSEIGSVTVLDVENQTSAIGFATGISPIRGYLHAGLTQLRLSEASAQGEEDAARLEEVRQDAVRASGALRYASSLAYSSDGRHAYSLDWATDSVTLVAPDKPPEGEAYETGDFVDRRRHGETRSRLVQVGKEALACTSGSEDTDVHNAYAGVGMEAVCSLAGLRLNSSNDNGGDVTLVAVGSGCQDVSEVESLLHGPPAADLALKLDRPSLSPCVDQSTGSACAALEQAEGEALWQATVGWWEFEVRHLGGNFSRARHTSNACTEQFETNVRPSSFSNLRAQSDSHETLGPAVLQGPSCKGVDWDRAPGSELSAHNILMAYGELQAAQFDGTINPGLVVADDVNALAARGVMPSLELSAESWITINSLNVPYAAILAAQRSGGSPAGGGPRADGDASEPTDPAPTSSNVRGWSLGYSVATAEERVTIVFLFTLSVVVVGSDGDGGNPQVAELTVSFRCEAPLCVPEEWLHVVGSYNGTDAAIYINGKLRASRSCAAVAAGAAAVADGSSQAQCGQISYSAAPGEEPEAVAQTRFVIGSFHNQRSGRTYTHVGGMRMARLYSRALSVDEVSGQFLEGVQPTGGKLHAVPGLWRARVSSSIFWLNSQAMGEHWDGTSTYNTATEARDIKQRFWPNTTESAAHVRVVPSPNVSRAGVQEQRTIQLQGRFLVSNGGSQNDRRYRCRFGFRHSRGDLTVAFTTATIGMDGRFYQSPSAEALAADPEAQPLEYGSSLSCPTPVWHHGFRVVHLGVEYEVGLQQRIPAVASDFNYAPGSRVEIDVALLGQVSADMPPGVSGKGTLAEPDAGGRGATRLGYVISHNYTTGRTLIDVPDVVEKGIFASLLDTVLPDVLVYPIPHDNGAPEPIWMPVWQRACAWRQCGYVEDWERSPETKDIYLSSLHLISGVPAKFVLYTRSFFLARASNGTSNHLSPVGGQDELAELEAPVSSLLSVRRWSGLYLMVSSDTDGSPTSQFASASHTNSVVYRVDNATLAGMGEGSLRVGMELVQKLPTKAARQWALGEVSSEGGLKQIIVLASLLDDLSLFSWINVSESGREALSLEHRVPNSDGASGAACLRIGHDTYVALALYYNRKDARYSTTSVLYRLHVDAKGSISSTDRVQEFPVVAATGVSHLHIAGQGGGQTERQLLAFLTKSGAVGEVRNTVVFEWQPAHGKFESLQELYTPGGAARMSLLDLSGGIHLMISMHAPCNTLKSGLAAAPGVFPDSPAAAGECSAMLRWNGTRFAGPFISHLSSLRDTASGQELPGASDMHVVGTDSVSSAAGASNIFLSVNFEQQVAARSVWEEVTEVGRRLTVTRNTRAFFLVQRSEHLACLGAPVSMLLDETAERSWTRVLVLSYHHSAITVMDRCTATGILSLAPNATQCVPALGPQPDAGWPRSTRGAVGMSMSRTSGGCFSDARYSTCLYVLDIGARPEAAEFRAVHHEEALGAIHVLGLEASSGQVQYLSSLVSGANAPQAPVSSTVSRYVMGLGGARGLSVSEDGLLLMVASHQWQAVTLFDLKQDTGELSYVDMLTEGERMMWTWRTELPQPSPAAFDFTLPQNVSAPDRSVWDFRSDGALRGEDSMLKGPSRITALGAGGVFWSESFTDANQTYLLVAGGKNGALLYRWNASMSRFDNGRQLSSTSLGEGGQDSDAWQRGIDVNCVHVTVALVPTLNTSTGIADMSPVAIVSNWISEESPTWDPGPTTWSDGGSMEPGQEPFARVRVFEWRRDLQVCVACLRSLPASHIALLHEKRNSD